MGEIAKCPLDGPGQENRLRMAAQEPDGATVRRELSRQCLSDEPRATGYENHEATLVAGSRLSWGTTVAAPLRVLGMLSRSRADPVT